MSRADELYRHARHHGHRAFVTDGLQQRHRAAGVPDREQRQRGLVPGVALAIGSLGVLFLQLRSVFEHDPGEVFGRRRTPDPSLETLCDQPRQKAAVIEVRVRENHRLDGIRPDRKRLPVSLTEILQSLKEATIDEQPSPVHLEQVLGSGDGARRAEKSQRHAKSPICPPVCQNSTVRSGPISRERMRRISPAMALAV